MNHAQKRTLIAVAVVTLLTAACAKKKVAARPTSSARSGRDVQPLLRGRLLRSPRAPRRHRASRSHYAGDEISERGDPRPH